MSNQVNQAFEKWLSDVKSKATQPLNYNNFLIKEAWQAATQARESEINSFKQRVEELEEYDLMQKSKLITQRVQITELTEDNNRLREALEKTFSRPKLQNEIDNILSSTPKQSLAQHDNAIIDSCKNIVADDALAITFQSMGAYRSAIIKAINGLKG